MVKFFFGPSDNLKKLQSLNNPKVRAKSENDVGDIEKVLKPPHGTFQRGMSVDTGSKEKESVEKRLSDLLLLSKRSKSEERTRYSSAELSDLFTISEKIRDTKVVPVLEDDVIVVKVKKETIDKPVGLFSTWRI